ncbi:MAG: 4-hydroxy-tetrahydrodipicolinate synthase [Fimbriimonadaceae bacterium]|nr:4-hydroxy-tetrahydrodipicolinate synthase [Fimbriimonadaceae bacterium]
MGSFRGPKDWGRLITAMMTPFHPDGSINESEVKRVATFLVDEQANSGLLISGTTGESPTLTADEKLRLLELTLEAVGDRAAVIFGAGTYDTRESAHLAVQGERRGAHGIMLVNPYYSRPGQAGLEAHFRAIASEVSLPVMLYNIQGRSAINLETPTLLRLAEVPNIVAVKEASGNLSQISEVIATAPSGFRIYSGDDGITLPVLSMGGFGIVSVAAHICGAQMMDMIQAYLAGDIHNAAHIHQRLQPVFRALFLSPSPVPIKYALSRWGFDTEAVRLPLVRLTDGEKSPVDLAMDGAELGAPGKARSAL